MEENTDTQELLGQILCPAFIVKDGTVTDANYMALQRNIAPGTRIGDMLYSGQQEYSEFSQGRLCLSVCADKTTYNASVVRTAEHDVFYLESEYIDPELRILAAAAQALRDPLSDAMLCAESLRDKGGEFPALNRSLYRLHRAICNMSDASAYSNRRLSKMENCNLSATIDEVIEKAGSLLQKAGSTLGYTGLNHSVFAIVDREKLERAILNLISNAFKYGKPGCPVHVQLQCSRNQLRICVSNRAKDPSAIIYGTLFSGFQREPSIHGGLDGIGLGMTIARNAAAAHKGTLLFDQPEEDTVRFTLSIPLNQKPSNLLRAPILYPIDYYGGYDSTLTELSDVLPAELFE